MKHYHVYDTTGEVMCVDADTLTLDSDTNLLYLHNDEWVSTGPYVAVFNWSNVVCVREEEDDDEGDQEVPLPDWIPGDLLLA